MRRVFHKIKCHSGFSLIETSIVLLIAGLLITASLKGVSLLYKAKLYNLQSQVKRIRMAVSEFKEKYGGLPGDVSLPGVSLSVIQSGVVSGDPFSSSSKAGLFWQQLFKEGLYTESGKSADGTLMYSRGLPSSSFGGGFTIHHNPKGLLGHWMQLSNGGATEGEVGEALLTPQEAHQIDKIIDNGVGNSGKIRAFAGKNAQGQCLAADGDYDLSNPSKACVLYFDLED